MLFNSAVFAVFFPLVLGLYWLLRRRYAWQNLLLLAAAMIFYGWWDVRFLYLFILTTTVDFYCAGMIAHGKVAARQRLIESLVLVGSAFFCVTVQWKALPAVWKQLHSAGSVHWGLLLPSSLSGWYVLLGTLAMVTLVNAGDRWLTSIGEQRRRKVYLVASIVSNFAVLGFFKYYNFFAESFAASVHALFGITPSAWTLHIILPVGISFYTFQSLAYTIDVYRGKAAAMDRYLTLAACLSFFPLLVAGPIERPNHLFPQFLRPRSTTRQHWREGMWLIFWGLFKKMVVADNMALVVASVFGPYDGASPSHLVPADGLRMLFGVYAFAFQIYGDFSGYSDIARGTARLMGFDVMLNFNLPYFALSPSDFWTRWHISLSTWLRDYLYIPLGGNRYGTYKTYRNLSLTMLLGGLWHGAAWTFVLWGAYHGLLLVAYRIFAPSLGEKKKAVPLPAAARPAPETAAVAYSFAFPLPLPKQWLAQVPWGRWMRNLLLGLLMFHLTCLGWLLFRAQNLTTVRVFIESIFTQPHLSAEAIEAARKVLFYSWFLVLFQVFQLITGALDPMKKMHWFLRLNVWILVIMSLLAFASDKAQSFIYFAF